MKAQIYLETTDVAADRSAAEITAELVKAGARSVSTQYGDAGKIVGMTWTFRIQAMDVSFSMPARVDGIFEHLLSRAKRASGFKSKPEMLAKLRTKAERIAWRQLLRWVQIQNAMIETGMAQPAEVFMPYACAPGSDRTMFEIWSAQLALPAPEPKGGGAA